MPLGELWQQRPEEVAVVPNTGIQFIDLGFSIPKDDESVPYEWAWLDPRKSGADSCATLKQRNGEFFGASQGGHSYTIHPDEVLEVFERMWMPLPLLRRQGADFFKGPVNWARAHLTKLPRPDEQGNSHRLVVALDTTLMPFADDEAYLAPCPDDARSGPKFEVPAYNDSADWFFAQPWVVDWCNEAYEEYGRREDYREEAPGPHYSESLYRAYVDLLQALQLLPPVRLIDRVTDPGSVMVDVDLVLDLGNSRTCGLLIEQDPNEAKADLANAVKLQLRDLSRIEEVYTEPFPSRLEFARARFGRDDLSARSGRSSAFNWPSIVRVGVEAGRLAAERSVAEGAYGLSSPKRYLWDTENRKDEWRVNPHTIEEGDTPFAKDVKITALVNEFGEARHRIEPGAGSDSLDRLLPATRARYSRSSLTSFALAEVIIQALGMMNSPMYLYKRTGTSRLARRLRRIIMTIPTALPLKERYILKRHAEAARDLAYVSLNLAQVNEDDFSVIFGEECGYGGHAPAAGPEVVLRWDEATATQMVYLYTEVAQNYSGAAHRFFDTVRRPENAADASLNDTLRLGTLDVGGGTTDLVITRVGAEGVRNSSSVTLTIDPLFSEGFKIAGDDAMLQVVKDHFVPPLKGALVGAGLGEERAERVLSQIMGPDHGNRQALDYIRRQQFTALVAAPVGLAMLGEYEDYDPLSAATGHSAPRRLEEFLDMGDESVRVVIEHFNAVARREGARDFRVQDARVPVNLAAIDRTVRQTFEWMLAAMGELVRAYRCDVLILSGRTSRLPAVRAILEAGAVLPGHRIVSLHQYRVGPWYPFRDERSTVGDPKTTAAVGAMICQLGGNLANFSLRSESLQARSTARHFGKVSPEGRLNKEDTFYEDLDLENLEYQLPENKSFEFRNPMDLGFKQLGVPWWPATKLYHIDYASPADSAKLHPLIPLMVVLKLVPRTEGRSKALVYPDFEIYSVTLRDGRRAPGNLKLKLQTLDDPKGYWLDTGILLEN